MTDTNLENEPKAAETQVAKKSDPWNRAEPRSLVNLVPPVAADAFLAASKDCSYLFGHDEETLHKTLKSIGALPTATDNRLRVSFWMEYERAQMSSSEMEMRNVYEGVCSKSYFYHNYLSSAPKVAWLTCQISSYEKYADEAITFGLGQLRDVLSIPHVEYGDDGKITKLDTKLVELKAKIVFGLEARRKGAVVQRVEQKNMNLSISTTDKQLGQAAMEGTMEQLEKRLEEIRKRQRKARAEIEAPVEAIEVKSEVSEETP